MTIEELRQRIKAITAVEADPETAHGREDDLIVAVALAFAPSDIVAELQAHFETERVRWYS